jgi:hypothetical protein
VPEATCGRPGAIVYGHGVFTCGGADFNGALERLITIERRCFTEYCNLLGLFMR